MFKFVRGILKITAVFALIFLYMLCSLSLSLLPLKAGMRKSLRTHLIGFYSGLGLVVLGVTKSTDGYSKNTKGLFVGNHLSYLDILVLSSIYPSCFVTSKEIKNTPFLGQLCELGGCLYVDRRTKKNLNNEIEEITSALKTGMSVTIFPEATSTNGDSVLRFRRPLYRAAVNAKVGVVPFCLNYDSVSGEKLTKSLRDHIFWYGDMSFLPHLWNFCCQSGCHVRVHFLNEVESNFAQEGEEASLAEITHKMVSDSYQPIIA